MVPPSLVNLSALDWRLMRIYLILFSSDSIIRYYASLGVVLEYFTNFSAYFVFVGKPMNRVIISMFLESA